MATKHFSQLLLIGLLFFVQQAHSINVCPGQVTFIGIRAAIAMCCSPDLTNASNLLSLTPHFCHVSRRCSKKPSYLGLRLSVVKKPYSNLVHFLGSEVVFTIAYLECIMLIALNRYILQVLWSVMRMHGV